MILLCDSNFVSNNTNEKYFRAWNSRFNEIVIINGSTLNFTKQILYRLCYFLLYLKAVVDLITLPDFKAISILRRNLK